MRALINFSGLDEVIKRKLVVFRGELGSLEGVREMSSKELFSMTLKDLGVAIVNKTMFYEDDPDEANTIVIRKFENNEDMEAFALVTDWDKLKVEMDEKYGPNTGYIDPKTLEFCLTLHRKEKNV